MFKRLTIKNFQTHKLLKVDLDPRVTTIVGPSDVGKSAVIRAVKWLGTNSPSGDSFIRDGSKSTSVSLLLSGEQEILRKRGGATNLYSLGKQEFKAFGNDVPPEIAFALNISEINFQGQHDSPFWFCETAGEVSRQLNKIVDLSIIDSTLAHLDKAGREARSRIRVVEERVQTTKEKRSSLVYARKMDKDLTGVETFHVKWEESTEKPPKLRALITQVQTHQKTTKNATQAIGAADKVIALGDAWLKVHQREIQLMKLMDDVDELQDKIHKTLPNLEPLFELKKQVEKTVRIREKLEGLRDDLQEDESSVRDKTRGAQLAQEHFDREMGDVCALCGRSG